jgi:pimeloyl-ACP methyl ester carboxylesterase
MTLDLLAEDLVGLLKAMFPDRSTAPKILLVGHSMVR